MKSLEKVKLERAGNSGLEDSGFGEQEYGAIDTGANPDKDTEERKRIQELAKLNNEANYLTIEEAATYLGVKKRTLYGYIKTGLIASHQPRRRIYVSMTELIKFIERDK